MVNDVADAFIEKVVARARALRQETAGEFDVGAMFWPRQLEIVERHVDEAVARGARVLVGGRRNPRFEGLFYEPTVVVDVRSDMALMRDETFGPVLPIVRVRDVDEAIARANDTRYGLGANVWTRDAKAAARDRPAHRLGQRLRERPDHDLRGRSRRRSADARRAGWGRCTGRDGLRGYCHAQPILIRDRFGGRQAGSHYPYSEKRDAGMKKLIRFLFGTPLGRWLS